MYISCMQTGLNDTDPLSEKVLIEGYRKMTPWKKLRCVGEMTKAVRQMALARIKKQYGGISGREQNLRLASLWLDRETMIKVFGWDPEKEGY
jgi:hypothetical protein